jgi:hypothetical protein
MFSFPSFSFLISTRRDFITLVGCALAEIIHKQRSSGILSHNEEERQDAAATNNVYE